MKSTGRPRIAGIVFVALLLWGALAAGSAWAKDTLLYIVRHTEKQTVLEDNGGCLMEACVEFASGKSCCAEELSDLGLLRRDALTGWFARRRITASLTHVFSSHKPRTMQTVEGIAADAGLTVEPLAPAECLVPDTECEEACASGKVSIPATLAAIRDLPPGSTALIGQHSGTIYLILEELGIDTSDPYTFPRDDDGKVAGYDNLWKIRIRPTGEAELARYQRLEFVLRRGW